MKTDKAKPLMAFINQPESGRLRIEPADPVKQPRASYVWRPGQKRMTREVFSLR